MRRPFQLRNSIIRPVSALCCGDLSPSSGRPAQPDRRHSYIIKMATATQHQQQLPSDWSRAAERALARTLPASSPGSVTRLPILHLSVHFADHPDSQQTGSLRKLPSPPVAARSASARLSWRDKRENDAWFSNPLPDAGRLHTHTNTGSREWTNERFPSASEFGQ